MPLSNAGRELFQTTVKNLATHVRLVIADGEGAITYSPTQAITFTNPDALAGIRTFDAYVFDITVCTNPADDACDFTEVVGIQLTNSTASTIYMTADFPERQLFTNSGKFSLTGIVASFF